MACGALPPFPDCGCQVPPIAPAPPCAVVRAPAAEAQGLCGAVERAGAVLSCFQASVATRCCATVLASLGKLSKSSVRSDAAKLDFLTRALRGEVGGAPGTSPASVEDLPPSVVAAILWTAKRSAGQARAERDRIMVSLRKRAAALWANGAVEAWFHSAEPGVRKVAQHVNGPLCAEIAQAIGFQDAACVELFRVGAPLIGVLPCSGHGRAEVFPACSSERDLLRRAASQNTKLIKSLREDENSSAVLKLTRDEAVTGRISAPKPLADVCLAGAVVAPRFAVAQQREDGSTKLRLVDDMSRSMVNEATQPQERLRYDGVDLLCTACRLFRSHAGVSPHLWKADIDSAYRRVPLRASHRRLAMVAFRAVQTVWVSQHFAAPFGATSSVHSWGRIGAFLAEAARRMLFLPALRYADDYFSPEHPGVAEHAAQCFAELVSLLLGPGAVAPAKVGWGTPLIILGLEIQARARPPAPSR